VPKIEEILEAGADPKVTDLDGNTPLELAGKNNADKKEVVEAMLRAKM
jgi:ankyrin repeat protein